MYHIELRIKEAARQRGVSQGRLSRLADIDINTMRRLFREPLANATLETLERVANALQCDVRELIEWVPDEEEQ